MYRASSVETHACTKALNQIHYALRSGQAAAMARKNTGFALLPDLARVKPQASQAETVPQLAAERAQMAEYPSSSFWRVTAPLRRTVSMVRPNR